MKELRRQKLDTAFPLQYISSSTTKATQTQKQKEDTAFLAAGIAYKAIYIYIYPDLLASKERRRKRRGIGKPPIALD